MSKPRSKLFNYAKREFRTAHGFTTAIHFGKQAKHMPGQPNHDATKSIITIPLARLQELVELKAGTGTWHDSKETIDFGVEIGRYRKPGNDKGLATSMGTIHYSKTGAHVVPAHPDSGARKGKRP
jgi:hypothetical protein